MHHLNLILYVIELFLRIRLLFLKFLSLSLLKLQLHWDMIRGGSTRLLVLRRERRLALIFVDQSKRFFIHINLPIVLEAILCGWERVTLRYWRVCLVMDRYNLGWRILVSRTFLLNQALDHWLNLSEVIFQLVAVLVQDDLRVLYFWILADKHVTRIQFSVPVEENLSRWLRLR